MAENKQQNDEQRSKSVVTAQIAKNYGCFGCCFGCVFVKARVKRQEVNFGVVATTCNNLQVTAVLC